MSEEITNTTLLRSPLLMNREDTALLIIDVQEKLLPHIRDHERITFNLSRLIRGANALGVDVRATEQYPKGLGATVPEIAGLIESTIPEKTMFSCRECETLIRDFQAAGKQNVVLAGMETHVCVAQTALDYFAAGFNVFLCVDAIGSRFEIDHMTALRRLEYSGITPTTTEAALFEWCERAGSAEFKVISQLAREKM